MCRSLDGTYVYVLVACHVHICGECAFFFGHSYYVLWDFLDLGFLSWLVDFVFPNMYYLFMGHCT
jgi:hypothetical protein